MVRAGATGGPDNIYWTRRRREAEWVLREALLDGDIDTACELLGIPNPNPKQDERQKVDEGGGASRTEPTPRPPTKPLSERARAAFRPVKQAANDAIGALTLCVGLLFLCCVAPCLACFIAKRFWKTGVKRTSVQAAGSCRRAGTEVGASNEVEPQSKELPQDFTLSKAYPDGAHKQATPPSLSAPLSKAY